MIRHSFTTSSQALCAIWRVSLPAPMAVSVCRRRGSVTVSWTVVMAVMSGSVTGLRIRHVPMVSGSVLMACACQSSGNVTARSTVAIMLMSVTVFKV